jgi:hypothetical protein
MNYLLRLRRFLRVHSWFGVIFGGSLFIVSTVAAIFLHFSYFYSSFVIGIFLFFDSLVHILDKTLAFTSNLERVGVTFWSIIIGFVIATDLVGGQLIFTVWRYPPYHSALNWLLLYGIIYPVGGLSVIAMFRFFDLLFGRIFPGRLFSLNSPEVLTRHFLRAVAILEPLVLLIPLVLFLTGLVSLVAHLWILYFLLFLFIFFEWTFFFDALVFAFGGRPIILDLLRGEKRVILALVLSGLISASLHELINTYVHEWVYIAEKFPVTSATLLGVPVMVFITWIPLTIVCVEAYRFAMVVRDRHLISSLKRAFLEDTGRSSQSAVGYFP